MHVPTLSMLMLSYVIAGYCVELICFIKMSMWQLIVKQFALTFAAKPTEYRSIYQSPSMTGGSLCKVIAYHGASMFGAVRTTKSTSRSFQHSNDTYSSEYAHAVYVSSATYWSANTIINCNISVQRLIANYCGSVILPNKNLAKYVFSIANSVNICSYMVL